MKFPTYHFLVCLYCSPSCKGKGRTLQGIYSFLCAMMEWRFLLDCVNHEGGIVVREIVLVQ